MAWLNPASLVRPSLTISARISSSLGGFAVALGDGSMA
jgi:hypothetical protein